MAKLIRTVPPLPQTERGRVCPISTDAPGDRVLYCNGSNVLWRSLATLANNGNATEKPEEVFTWKGHSKRTTVVAMSPNSNWVVSGDVTGAIRLWGAQGENIQKAEYKLWDGEVKDVSFSGDSTRIVASGDGKEVRAVALLADTGSKTGEVAFHSKQINSISFRSQRPFRIVTGGEDMAVVFHQGPPFKLHKTHNNLHSNFVNGVRYSPDGNFAVSVGSDAKVVLYEGKEGELVKEFAKPDGITGSLWAVAWSPDSSRFATAGGDKRLRLWDREAGAQLAEAQVGAAQLEDMLLGVAWPTANRIVTVCLDGRLLLWDVDAAGALQIASTVDGTQGPLNCVARDPATGALIQGGTDGFVAVTRPGQPTQKAKVGKTICQILGHRLGDTPPAEAWVFSLGGCAQRLSVEDCQFVGEPVELPEFPMGAAWLDVAETVALVVSGKNGFCGLSVAGVAWNKPNAVPRQPTAVDSAPLRGLLAVALDKPEGMVAAGVQSSQFDIQLFNIEYTSSIAAGCSPDGIVPSHVLQGHQKEITALRFTPSGDMLASADAGSKIMVWSVAGDGSATCTITDFYLHTARVSSLDWLECGRRLVSGSLDQQVFVWNADKKSEYIKITEAHRGGVTSVTSCGAKSFASVGHDGFLKVHAID